MSWNAARATPAILVDSAQDRRLDDTAGGFEVRMKGV
jgi:hypothetical protein